MSASETPTPRTDAAAEEARHAIEHGGGPLTMIALMSESMEELERELTAAKADATEARNQMVQANYRREDADEDLCHALALVAKIREALGDNGKRMQDELVEHCKALVADSERLDWLEKHASIDRGNCDRYEHDVYEMRVRTGKSYYGSNAQLPLRAAIDAAMSDKSDT